MNSIEYVHPPIGYDEERWHWSYVPVAKGLLQGWMDNQAAIEVGLEGAFLGSDTVKQFAPTYASVINPVAYPSPNFSTPLMFKI